MASIPHMQNTQASSNAKQSNENFPVASFLLPKKARKPIHAFYNFARHADDIADDTEYDPQAKTEALNALSEAISKRNTSNCPGWMKPYIEALTSGVVCAHDGQTLLSAFLQDVNQKRYSDWDALLDYCNRSAAPVGRTVLDACEEYHADLNAADALCNVLQILNHIQDMKEDYETRNRIYLPSPWIPEAASLRGSHMTPALRLAVDQALDGSDDLIARAQALPVTIKRWSVRAELCTILKVAERLSRKLRSEDVLERHVGLTKLEKLKCLRDGMIMAFKTKPPKAKRVSILSHVLKSSFFWPMARLSAERRHSIFILYDFCREVDDAADEAVSSEAALASLDEWKADVEALYTDAKLENPVLRRLRPIIQRYGLERHYLDEIILGMEMDAAETMVKPPLSQLETYCYRAASCVGLLSIPIFGYTHPDTPKFAESLGKGLQLINITRDIEEDARRGRIYLPMELLKQHSLGAIGPEDIAQADPDYLEGLQHVVRSIQSLAQGFMDDATKLLAEEDRAAMKPALLMQQVYQSYLDKMKQKEWQYKQPRVSMGMSEKLRVMFLPPEAATTHSQTL